MDRPTAIAITDLQVLFICSSFRSTSETSDEGRILPRHGAPHRGWLRSRASVRSG